MCQKHLISTKRMNLKTAFIYNIFVAVNICISQWAQIFCYATPNLSLYYFVHFLSPICIVIWPTYSDRDAIILIIGILWRYISMQILFWFHILDPSWCVYLYIKISKYFGSKTCFQNGFEMFAPPIMGYICNTYNDVCIIIVTRI